MITYEYNFFNMKSNIVKSFFISIFFCLGTYSQNQTLSATKFNPKSADLLIDVRTPEEFEQGHLPSAVNINYFDSNFAEKVNKLPKNKKVYLYCKTGIRSEKAAKVFDKAGFTKTYMLEGGILAWKAAGKPLKKN